MNETNLNNPLYNQYLKVVSKFNNDIDLILKAFIAFYGEQHEEYIFKKINNSRIVWFDDEGIIQSDDIHDHIISSIPTEELEKLLKKRSNKAFLQSAYIDELDLLVLPLSYNLEHIIHEINHKISSHLLSLEPLFQINGINYAVETNNGIMDYDEFLNEAINQMMTLEILGELDNLGLKVKIGSSWQQNLFPLINLFYETFKDLLKATYISGNLSHFIELLGEDNYRYFSQIFYLKAFRIRNCISKGIKVDISQEDINIVEEIVRKMKNYYDEYNNKIKMNK